MATENSSIPDPKICGSCGDSFGCGAKLDGCWCVGVKVDSDTATDLKATFNDCLCPKCLANEADPVKTK